MKNIVDNFKKDISTLLNIEEKEITIEVYDNSSSVPFALDEFYNQYNPEELTKGLCNIILRIDIKESPVATVRMKDLLGCAGVLVVTDLNVTGDMRNKGIGTKLMNFVTEFANYYGYSVLQCTDLANNKPMEKIFNKLNWSKITEFVNKKTSNTVALWCLEIEKHTNSKVKNQSEMLLEAD